MLLGVIRSIPSLPARRFALRVANAALKRRPVNYEIDTPLGFRFAGNTRDVIQRHVYVFGVWEPDITAWVRQHVRQGDTVVDVGANVGYFTLLAAELSGAVGSVYAVEPLPTALDQLRRNVALNRPETVTIHAVACGESEGTAEIFGGDASNIGNASTVGGGTSEGKVRRATLDTLLANVDLEKISLVKIDTEGDEAAVLLGAQRTLAGMRTGAAVIAEVTPEMLHGRGMVADQVLRMMAAAGFDAYAIENDYTPARYADRRVRPPVHLVSAPRSAQDVVFIKR